MLCLIALSQPSPHVHHHRKLLLSIVFILFNSIQSSIAFPCAFSFIPSSITASHFLPHNTLSITSILAPISYTTHFQDALANHSRLFFHKGHYVSREKNGSLITPQNTHDMETASNLFRDIINPLTKYLTAVYGSKPEYISHYLIPAFNRSSIHAAPRGLHAENTAINHPTRMGNTAQAKCLAYGLDICSNCGRTAIRCVDPALTNLILVLEYEKKSLYVSLLQTDEEYLVFPKVEEEMSKDLGESSRVVLGDAMYKESLREYLRPWLGAALEVESYGERDDVRAIVLAGWASIDGFEAVSEVAAEAVNNAVVKVFHTTQRREWRTARRL
ncbi:hypothetical protein CC80DRAFT_545501 [Byssothecium circinans]|uniref:Uncharacterized protein n=1 Tax=Byssothecium circinans TaxID=147558 RepID=A0A6A5UDB4_9PLEO|nr:hypothetical protein CC80DRAFT_545501 [Byssothecium circinans]